MAKRLTFEFVEQCFEDGGCELLEREYTNANTKMKYICSCGNISKTTFSSFRKGHRCNICGWKRLTFEYIDHYFKDHGCKLLETEYVNNHTKMTYICSCGNISKITFGNFKSGKRCVKCSGNEKHTLEFAKQCFKDGGCVLLEKEYINANTPMKYICECENISKISFSNFQKGRRCMECSGNKKYTLEFVKQCFLDGGCVLLEKEYIGANDLMDYLCVCKRKSKICFKQFLNGQRCRKCGTEKSSEKLKLTLEFAKQCFKDGGCKLLEKEYINNNIKMKYICECGDIHVISFANFQKGKRCKKCGLKKMSGKNSPSYNPNLTDKDRVDRRKIFGYGIWVKDTYKKDDYTCQKCKEKKDNNNKRKKLNAHHIEGYAENPDLILDNDNGITFCVACHHSLHSIYGKKNVNRQQLEEFLNIPILGT